MLYIDDMIAFRPYSRRWLNSLSDRQKRTVAKSAFGRQLHDSGCRHVSHLWWFSRDTRAYASTDIHHGSVFFLDMGSGPIGVTAAHVVNEYLRHFRSRQVLCCKIGNVPIDLHKRIISVGKRDDDLGGVDIATFRIAPAEVQGTRKKVVKQHGRWLRPPKDGEMIFFAGFPAEARYMIAKDRWEFGLHSAMTPVTSVSHHQLMCRLTRKNWVDVRGLGLPPEDYNLAGISGGPLLVPVYRHKKWTWRLGGVITEAVANGNNEVVTAARADHITSGGRIVP